MNIRAAERGDHAPIRDLLVTAFPGPGEAELVERLRSEGDCSIELVAEDGQQIVGHIFFSPARAPFRALALGPVAVAPERQSQGIGAALIETGHDLARAQGWDAIFLLGDPAYYQRFGYDAALAAGFSSPYAGTHFMALALDGPLSALHGDVHYARAFADLS